MLNKHLPFGDIMRKTVIIFDLDGTILNTDELIIKSFRHVYDTYLPEYPITMEEIMIFLGPPLSVSFSKDFKGDMVNKCIDEYGVYNRAHHKDYVTLYEGEKEALRELKDMGYPLAVFTTKRNDIALYGLELFGLSDYFDAFVGGDDVTHVKPDPEGITMIKEFTKTKEAVMVGDNASDLMAGKNAKALTVGVNWSPKGTKHLEVCEPDLMMSHFNDLVEFVKMNKLP